MTETVRKILNLGRCLNLGMQVTQDDQVCKRVDDFGGLQLLSLSDYHEFPT